jgi:branched-chain amino acid transport system substrate-binding protein
MKGRSVRRRIGLLFALLLVVGTGSLRAADEPYDFYAILPITGPAAFLGRGEQVGLQAIEKYVNATGGVRGRPLHIIAQDDQSNPALAVQIANQIIAKHVPAFLGPGFTATCAAVQPLVVTSGPVMYCMSSGLHPPSGSYAFVYGLSSTELTATMLRYLKAKGVRKIALLVTTDATGQDGETALLAALKLPELAGMQLVATEHFGSTDLSITAQVTRLKASGAEALDAWTSGTPLGTALRGLNEAGWEPHVLTSLANAVPEQLSQYSSFVPRDLLFTSLGYQMVGIGNTPPATRVAKSTFLDAMHQIGVAEPTVPNVVPWDPMMLMIGALRKIGPQGTATQVRDYLLSLGSYAGANGMYNFTRSTASNERNRGLDPLSSGVIRWDKDARSFPIISRPGGLPL